MVVQLVHADAFGMYITQNALRVMETLAKQASGAHQCTQTQSNAETKYNVFCTNRNAHIHKKSKQRTTSETQQMC